MPIMPGQKGAGMGMPKLQMMSPGLPSGAGPAINNANMNLRPISGGGNYRPTMINQPTFDQDMERYAAQQFAKQNHTRNPSGLPMNDPRSSSYTPGRPDARFIMDKEASELVPPPSRQSFAPLQNTPVEPVSSIEAPIADDALSSNDSQSSFADQDAAYLNDNRYASLTPEASQPKRWQEQRDDVEIDRYEGRIDDVEIDRYEGRIDDVKIDRYEGRIDDVEIDRYEGRIDDDLAHEERQMAETMPSSGETHHAMTNLVSAEAQVQPSMEEPLAPAASSSDTFEDSEERFGSDRFAGRGRGRVPGRMTQRSPVASGRGDVGVASSQYANVRRTTNASNPSLPVSSGMGAAAAMGRRMTRGRIPVASAGRMAGQFHSDVEDLPVMEPSESPMAAIVADVEPPEEFRSEAHLHTLGAHVSEGVTHDQMPGDENAASGALADVARAESDVGAVNSSEYQTHSSSAHAKAQKPVAECEDAMDARHAFEEEKAVLLQRIQEVETALAESEEKLYQAQDALTELKDSFDMAVSDRDKAEGKLDILKQEMEAQGVEFERLKTAVSESENAVREAHQSAEEWRDALNQAQAAFESLKQDHQRALDEKNDCLERIQNAEHDVASMAADVEMKNHELENTRQMLDEVSAQRDELNVQMEHMQEELQEANAELEDLRLRLNDGMGVNFVDKDALKAQKAELDSAHAQLEQLGHDNGALRGELDSAHAQLEQVLAEKDAVLTEKEALQAQIVALQAHVAEASTEIQHLHGELERVSSDNNAEKDDHIAALESELSQVQSDKSALTEQLSQCQSSSDAAGDADALRVELEAARTAAESEISALRARVEKVMRQRDEAANAYHDSATQLQALMAQQSSSCASSACSDFVRTWAPRFASIIEFAQDIANALDATEGLDPSVSANAHEMLNALVKVNRKLVKASDTLS